MTDASFVQVMTTIDSVEAARALADEIVRQRLAACVQLIGPIESHYWWNGEIETATEWLCLIKTHRRQTERLTNTISELHSYDVPEVTVTDIVGGHPPYLEWIRSETRER